MTILVLELVFSLFFQQMSVTVPQASPPSPGDEVEDEEFVPVVFDKDALLEDIPSPVAEPMGLAVHDGNLWITDMATRRIHEFHPVEKKVLRSMDAPGFMPSGITFHKGILYMADRRMDRIQRRRITPEGHTGLETIPYYERWAWGIASDQQNIWVVDARSNKIHMIDAEDGTTIRSFTAPGTHPTGITHDGQTLWVADHGTNTIYRMDPETGWVVSSVPSPGPYPSALAFFDNTLWVADYQSRKLYRLRLPGKLRVIEDDERRVRATYQVLYRAAGNGRVRNLTAHLAIPREMTGQRLLTPIRFDPEPTRIVEDQWGQKVAIFELGDLNSGETRSVRWIGDFSLFRVRFQMTPHRIRTVRTDRELGLFLGDDRKYNLRHPTLDEWMNKTVQNETNPYRVARRIYERLADEVVYDRSGGWNNAAAVLERKSGSCSEYTFALVALLRKAGIPARYVGAVSERGDPASFDDVFHRWAEAWFPDFGWVPMDANAGSSPDPAVRGLYFGGRTNRHVVTTVGGGASEYLDWTYNHHTRYELEDQGKLEEQPIGRYRPLVKPGKSPRRNILLVEADSVADPEPVPSPCPTVEPCPEASRRPVVSRKHLLLWGTLFGGLFLLVFGIYLALRFQKRNRR